jgi:hypothetical protein
VETKTFQDAKQDIIDNIEKMLKAEINIDGGKLSDVKTLVISEKTTVALTVPMLWVETGIANCTEHTGECEHWEMDIMILSVVYNSNSKKGHEEANDLTARAKNVLLGEYDGNPKRTLGFGHGTFFGDIKSLRFEGNNREFSKNNKFSAVYTCQARFTTRED